MLFAGRYIEGEPIVTSETRDAGWFAREEVPWDALHGSHSVRIRFAFEWLSDPSLCPFYDEPRWEPRPTWQHGGEAESAE